MQTSSIAVASILTVFLVAGAAPAAHLDAEMEPTMWDTMQMELQNLYRADPQFMADAMLGGELNEGVPATKTIDPTPKQPLAFNLNLVAAAHRHVNDLIANDRRGHTGSDGTQPWDRAEQEGYIWSTGGGVGENLAAIRQGIDPGQVTGYAVGQMLEDLFIDEGYANRGHRTNMLNPTFESVGVAVAYSSSWAPLGAHAELSAQVFGYKTNEGPFLTGVAYDDLNGNDFYSAHEGLGGVSVTATPVGAGSVASTETWEHGAYTLELEPGIYSITFSSPRGVQTIPCLEIVDQNVKVDYQVVSSLSLLVDPTGLTQTCSALTLPGIVLPVAA